MRYLIGPPLSGQIRLEGGFKDILCEPITALLRAPNPLGLKAAEVPPCRGPNLRLNTYGFSNRPREPLN